MATAFLSEHLLLGKAMYPLCLLPCCLSQRLSEKDSFGSQLWQKDQFELPAQTNKAMQAALS